MRRLVKGAGVLALATLGSTSFVNARRVRREERARQIYERYCSPPPPWAQTLPPGPKRGLGDGLAKVAAGLRLAQIALTTRPVAW